jgi:hypothetical protein
MNPCRRHAIMKSAFQKRECFRGFPIDREAEATCMMLPPDQSGNYENIPEFGC